MYLNRSPISREEALEKLSALELKPRIIKKSLKEARTYVLAEDIFASFPIPAFRRSGYDGFGILAEDDVDFPREFEVLENIGAGANFKEKLSSGQAVRIMTGAKVPEAVAKVIMLESSEAISEKIVRILESPDKSNIAEIGTELKEGQKILRRGNHLNAGAISLLYAFGIQEVEVYDKPRVAVLATGSELAEGHKPEDGKIYNSNGPLLAGLAEENGAIVVIERTIADNLEETRALVAELTESCDLVITTGGVSVGDFDFIAVIAKEQKLLFNKLAMRPGSPTTAFVMNGTPVLALSGNPSACFTGFWFFVEPLIKRFQTLETAVVLYHAHLPRGYSKVNEYDRYLNAYMDEQMNVTLNGHGQSSELSSLWQANCFFKIPHGTSIPEHGEVDIWLIP